MGFSRAVISEKGLNRKARAGDGALMHLRRTNQTTDSNQTISVAAILGGLYTRSGTNTNRTDTTETAANILAAMPEMDIGDTYAFMVSNATANPLVIAGGTNVTASGNLTVPTLVSKWFVLEKTSATTMTLYGC